LESMGERVRKSLHEFISTAAEKTDELAKVGVRKLDVVSLKRSIGREMAALGARVYHLLRHEGTAEIAPDGEVRSIVERIKALEAALDEKEKEISRIRQAARGARETPGEEKAGE